MDSEQNAVGAAPAGVHRPGTDRLWGESWYFDFAAVDGSAGGFVRVGDYPRLGRRWYWAYVVAGAHATGHALDLPLPTLRDVPWEAADPALRFVAEPAAGGWSIAAGGDGFGLDVTWREQAPEYGYARGSRMEQPGWAVGEVTLDGRSFPLDGPGQRDHSWGVRDWWRIGWTWCAGRLSDGTRFQATHLDARGRIPPDGYLMAPGGPPEPVRDVAVGADALRMNDTLLEFADVAHVTIDLRSPDGEQSRLRRAMTRVRAGATRHGIGWRERNMPERAARRA
ncbi:hypothetical protein ACFSKW_50875 [Nonomuraea mangrovi]|uniref:DUF7065 domain-containing protein n=1 Tax=Nonomuraea mangrovi TaxID=2316207 RepID=A0ABW4TFP9_9ACTN